MTGEGGSRKLEQVAFSEDALKAFEVLKEAYMMVPVLAFIDHTKPFLLETDASKDRLGAVHVPEAGRQTIAPSHLQQQSPYAT